MPSFLLFSIDPNYYYSHNTVSLLGLILASICTNLAAPADEVADLAVLALVAEEGGEVEALDGVLDGDEGAGRRRRGLRGQHASQTHAQRVIAFACVCLERAHLLHWRRCYFDVKVSLASYSVTCLLKSVC